MALSLQVTEKRARMLAKDMSKTLAPRVFSYKAVKGPVCFGVVYTVAGDGSVVKSSAKEGAKGAVALLTDMTIASRLKKEIPVVLQVPEFLAPVQRR